MEHALWKRLVAEFVGVFLLCSIGLMLVATSITTGAFGLFELSIAIALAIMVVAAISGGHINPSITDALAVYRRFRSI